MNLSDLDQLAPAEQIECVLQKLREQQLVPANLGVFPCSKLWRRLRKI